LHLLHIVMLLLTSAFVVKFIQLLGRRMMCWKSALTEQEVHSLHWRRFMTACSFQSQFVMRKFAKFN